MLFNFLDDEPGGPSTTLQLIRTWFCDPSRYFTPYFFGHEIETGRTEPNLFLPFSLFLLFSYSFCGCLTASLLLPVDPNLCFQIWRSQGRLCRYQPGRIFNWTNFSDGRRLQIACVFIKFKRCVVHYRNEFRVFGIRDIRGLLFRTVTRWGSGLYSKKLHHLEVLYNLLTFLETGHVLLKTFYPCEVVTQY